MRIQSENPRAINSPTAAGWSAPCLADTAELDRHWTHRAWQVARALRPYHWIKNLLVFVPLLMNHDASNGPLLLQALIAFGAFSLCASAGYLINDVLDIDADRQHPAKRNRPFASGAVPASWGVPLAILVLGLGLLASARLPFSFTLSLVAYVLIVGFYSIWLKRLMMVDVTTLAACYTLRLFAGGLATGLPVSAWLLAFSAMFFFSLACGKRCAELRRLAGEKKDRAHGRSYTMRDTGLLQYFGHAVGYMAGLALAVEFSTNALSGTWQNQIALWLICPLYFFGVRLFGHNTMQNDSFEDLVGFILRDRVSIAFGIGILIWTQFPING